MGIKELKERPNSLMLLLEIDIACVTMFIPDLHSQENLERSADM